MNTAMRFCSGSSVAVLIFFSSLVWTTPVYTQESQKTLSVVVSAGNSSIKSMSVKQVRKLYLGKSLKMPDGTNARLVIYKPLQTLFNRTALRRSDAQVEAIWARLKFSGRAKEPAVFTSVEALIQFLSENTNAIAYLPTERVNSRVRALLRIPH